MRWRKFSSVLLAALLPAAVFAAEPAAAPAPPAANAPAAAAPPVVPAAAVPPPIPAIAPEDALAGRALAEALRAGGFVLFMRHAEQVPAPLNADCAKHWLTPVGDEQARTVGAGMRRLGVPIGEVRTSPICRCLQTAVGLGLGEPVADPDLAPPEPRTDTGPARAKRLGTVPPAGRNTVLVSHQQGSRTPEYRITLGLADVIVFRPGPDGAAKPVARIAPADWAALAQSVGR